MLDGTGRGEAGGADTDRQQEKEKGTVVPIRRLANFECEYIFPPNVTTVVNLD
jgi:hypothetical protein